MVVREVGPRDGLQGERPLPPEQRIELVLSLVAAGCRRVEAASFVSEKAVPAMAGATSVIKGVRAALKGRGGVLITALVPNLRGALAALEAGVDELTVTVAASPGYNERNVRRTVEESVREIGQVVAAASEASVPVDAVISCAFGSPYEAFIAPDVVAGLAGELVASGVTALTLADTTGVATPLSIENVLEAVDSTAVGVDLGLHLHETQGTAMVNAYAALEAGVSRFDSAVGGLGGSPFAPGAGGNLATEDFVSLLDRLGVETGIELDPLLCTAEWLRQLVGHDLASKVRPVDHSPESL